MQLEEIYWGADEEETVYAKGHVDIDDFAAAAARHIGAVGDDLKHDVQHLWGAMDAGPKRSL